jgi:hypothetical protein
MFALGLQNFLGKNTSQKCADPHPKQGNLPSRNNFTKVYEISLTK